VSRPRPDLRIASEVFVADVETADPRIAAINDHDLPMVAKVDLKSTGPAADRVERPHLTPPSVNPRIHFLDSSWLPISS